MSRLIFKRKLENKEEKKMRFSRQKIDVFSVYVNVNVAMLFH